MSVAVLLGGASPEREISLQSGGAVADALDRRGFAPLRVDPKEDANWLQNLQNKKVGRVFNLLHGGKGENGEVRGALNCAGIASTGSDVLGCALAMNKPAAKELWRWAGIPTPDWRVAQSADEANKIAAELPPPWFVKPACGGSSTNSAPVLRAAELPAAIAAAAGEGGGALVERLVEGQEYTLAVANNKPLPLIAIQTARRFYDYAAKYEDDETHFECPPKLPEQTLAEYSRLALRAFFALRCAHWGRVDFIVDANGAPFFFEVNTVPGMTSHSLLPFAAARAGMDFDELAAVLLAGASGGGGRV